MTRTRAATPRSTCASCRFCAIVPSVPLPHGSRRATTVAMDNPGDRLRSAVQGPDGNLYVSTDNGSATEVIYRVVPR